MALTANTIRPYDTDGPIGNNELPVKASAVIYEGSAVGSTAGYHRALVSGDKFSGFALAAVTGTTDGAKNVNVRYMGRVQLAVTSVAVTDIGAQVYASDDGTFVLTAGGTPVGIVHRYVSSGVAIVAFDASLSQ